jgi:hypothetical protein
LTVKQRSKSSDTVFDELATLSSEYRTNNVFAVDNIMPRPFFNTLLPRLKDLPNLNLFYEQKSNLTLGNLKALKAAGVNLIQPGIESLSTPLLKLMKKGVAARHHIRLLRDARAVGISLNWNLLYDFPGDRAEYYEEMLKILPHLVHFSPPLRLLKLSLDRFSPYFEAPRAHGITGLRPKAAYAEILPEGLPLEQIISRVSLRALPGSTQNLSRISIARSSAGRCCGARARLRRACPSPASIRMHRS